MTTTTLTTFSRIIAYSLSTGPTIAKVIVTVTLNGASISTLVAGEIIIILIFFESCSFIRLFLLMSFQLTHTFFFKFVFQIYLCICFVRLMGSLDR